MLKINNNLQLDESEFSFSFARSSGPGGQNVNKLNTKAIMRWDIDACPSLPSSVKARFKDKYQNSETSRSGKRDMVECLIALALRFFVGGRQSSRV